MKVAEAQLQDQVKKKKVMAEIQFLLDQDLSLLPKL